MSSSPQGTLFQRKLSAFSNTDYFYHKHITAYRRSESFIFEELSMKDLKANFFICFNVLVAGVNGGPTFYLLTNYSKFAGKIAYSQDLALFCSKRKLKQITLPYKGDNEYFRLVLAQLTDIFSEELENKEFVKTIGEEFLVLIDDRSNDEVEMSKLRGTKSLLTVSSFTSLKELTPPLTCYDDNIEDYCDIDRAEDENVTKTIGIPIIPVTPAAPQKQSVAPTSSTPSPVVAATPLFSAPAATPLAPEKQRPDFFSPLRATTATSALPLPVPGGIHTPALTPQYYPPSLAAAPLFVSSVESTSRFVTKRKIPPSSMLVATPISNEIVVPDTPEKETLVECTAVPREQVPVLLLLPEEEEEYVATQIIEDEEDDAPIVLATQVLVAEPPKKKRRTGAERMLAELASSEGWNEAGKHQKWW